VRAECRVLGERDRQPRHQSRANGGERLVAGAVVHRSLRAAHVGELRPRGRRMLPRWRHSLRRRTSSSFVRSSARRRSTPSSRQAAAFDIQVIALVLCDRKDCDGLTASDRSQSEEGMESPSLGCLLAAVDLAETYAAPRERRPA
jgi:hypothetical protein